jgi:7-cyano-7-deazaguanine reductase
VPNPDPGTDYVVRFEMETTPSFSLGPLKFVTRYVPDKLLLKPACLGDYLHALTQPDWPTLESAALAMRDDFGNEVVPRWIAIAVSPSEANLEVARHSVLVEDRQPQWDNPNLLTRLQDCR